MVRLPRMRKRKGLEKFKIDRSILDKEIGPLVRKAIKRSKTKKWKV